MYNSDLPTRAELPSSAQLVKSTVLAIITAGVILITIVLPSEYAIDPTGVGRVLKLTEMGEIKQQLATEAEADATRDQTKSGNTGGGNEKRSSLGSYLTGILIGSAHAQTAAPAAVAATASVEKNETVVTLKPGEGVEYKMEMTKGAKVEFTWAVAGGVVNYDMHGTMQQGGSETSYKKGRGEAGDKGVLTAGFDGTHGWFWRNRGDKEVKVTLQTSGAYKNLHRVKK